MRVLYLHQYFSTPEGATGTRSYEMARRLVSRGHAVTVVCGSTWNADTGLHGDFRSGRREGVVEGIRVIELDVHYSNHQGFVKRALAFLRFAFRTAWIALIERFDVLFATSTPLTVGIPAIVARWLRGKRFIFEVRDLWPELPREMGEITNPIVLQAMEALEWLSYHSAEHLIGLSPGMVDGIVRRGVLEENVSMIPNGCDLETFFPRREGRKNRDIPGIEEGDFVAGYTGAHGIANGLNAVLDAAKVLEGRGSSGIKFLFVGDGKMKPELVRRARKEELNSCVFLDPIPKHDLAKVMNRVDVGLMILANVQAFYQGTSPNKFFDYIASGTPVLNNYPGWLADLIEEYKCGVVVPPDNAAAFADGIEGLKHSDCLEDMGSRARRLAEDRFDRDLLADAFEKCIRQVSKSVN